MACQPFRRCSAFRPFEVCGRWRTMSGWWHVDQNGNGRIPRTGRAAVQSLVSMYDQDITTGALAAETLPLSVSTIFLTLRTPLARCGTAVLAVLAVLAIHLPYLPSSTYSPSSHSVPSVPQRPPSTIAPSLIPLWCCMQARSLRCLAHTTDSLTSARAMPRWSREGRSSSP